MLDASVRYFSDISSSMREGIRKQNLDTHNDVCLCFFYRLFAPYLIFSIFYKNIGFGLTRRIA